VSNTLILSYVRVEYYFMSKLSSNQINFVSNEHIPLHFSLDSCALESFVAIWLLIKMTVALIYENGISINS
jgi:hypothetical protein